MAKKHGNWQFLCNFVGMKQKHFYMNTKEEIKKDIKGTDEMFISEDTLNSFKLRILDTVGDYKLLSKLVEDNLPFWNKPIEMCQRIEQNPLSIDTVIKEAMTDGKRFYQSPINTENAYHYNAILCRIYILLYYRHHDKKDEELYQSVYLRLKEYMGIYSSKYLDSINQKIDDILTFEKLAAARTPAENGKPGKGLTAPQARLFCEALLHELGCSDYQIGDDIVPLASSLFGHTNNTMDRAHTYDQNDRNVVAKLFEKKVPEFSEKLKNFGKTVANPELVEKSKKAGTGKEKE